MKKMLLLLFQNIFQVIRRRTGKQLRICAEDVDTGVFVNSGILE